jgi:nitroreductase
MGDDLKALLIDRFGLDLGLAEASGLTPLMARILTRRTHRAFTSARVDPALVDLLIAVALSASSKSDFQQVAIVKLKDDAKRKRIAVHFPDMPWIGTSPEFLVFCGDTRRLERIGTLHGHPEPNRSLEGFLNAAVDAALTLQTFTLAAESAGLGCCPISVLRNQMPLVAQELELPDGVFPVAGLCFGYPAGKGHISMRLPPSITVHTDRYDDAAMPDELDAYDRRRATRHAIPRDKQRNAGKFGTVDFYGWSEDKARQAAEPEGAPFAAYLMTHGFSFDKP